ncbi:hypothetical protein N9K35_04495 [Pseudomonadales bacterium]|nr:hypothetical protein [Pseudomonadales bacterium]
MSLFSRGNVGFSFSSLFAKLSVFFLLLLSPFFISQESIGIYALFNSWISLGVIFFYGPFEALIGREFVNFKNSESNSYYALKNYVNCVSVFLVAVTVIFYTFDLLLYDDTIFEFLFLAILIVGVQKFLVRELRFADISRATKVQIFKAALLIPVVVLIYYLKSDNPLVVGTLSVTGAMFLYLVYITKQFQNYFKNFDVQLFNELLKLYPNRLLGMGLLPFISILIAKDYSVDELSTFYIAVTIINALSLFMSSLADKYHQFVFSGDITSSDHRILIRSAKLLGVIVIIITGIGTLLIDTVGNFTSFYKTVLIYLCIGIPYCFHNFIKTLLLAHFLKEPAHSWKFIFSTMIYSVSFLIGYFLSDSLLIVVLCWSGSRVLGNIYSLYHLNRNKIIVEDYYGDIKSLLMFANGIFLFSICLFSLI